MHHSTRWVSYGVWGLWMALLAVMATAAPDRPGEDWPKFLGPTGDAISKETGLVERWGAKGPLMVWSKSVGTGYSAPSVREGKLVLHHRVEDEEVVECLDAVTGRPIWRYRYGSKFIDPYGYNNGPRCSPLLTAEYCYTFGAEGRLVCLELASGKLVWERDTAKEWEIPPAFFGVGSTPILEGDVLIVMVGGQPNSGMVGFDAKSGRTIWESVGERNWQGVLMAGWPGERSVEWVRHEKQASYATPVAANVHGKRRVFCLMRQGLVSLDPKNGEVDFSFWFRSRANDSVNAANPVVVGDSVFISGAYYRVGSVLLKVRPDHKAVTEVWRSTALEIHWATPVYHDGYLYAFSGRNEPDARFRCVEFATGNLMWDRDESWRHSIEPPKVYGRGSAILADGKLIVLGESGLLGMFRVNPKAPQEICRYQVPQLHYPCWAGPVLARKRLYLRLSLIHI